MYSHIMWFYLYIRPFGYMIMWWYIYNYIHTYIHMRIWAHIYIYTYVYTHTHSTYTCDPEVYYCFYYHCFHTTWLCTCVSLVAHPHNKREMTHIRIRVEENYSLGSRSTQASVISKTAFLGQAVTPVAGFHVRCQKYAKKNHRVSPISWI